MTGKALGKIVSEQVSEPFAHPLHSVIGLLVIEGRLSYRRLQAEFDLNDSQLEALRFELTEVKRLAVDQQGEILAWTATARRSRTEHRDRPLATQPACRLAEPTVPAGATEVASPPLLEASPAVEPPVLASVTSDAERWPLIVTYCDLADSTALSSKGCKRLLGELALSALVQTAG